MKMSAALTLLGFGLAHIHLMALPTQSHPYLIHAPNALHISHIQNLGPLQGRSSVDVLTNGQLNHALSEVQQQKIQAHILPNHHLMLNKPPQPHGPRLTDFHQTPLAIRALTPAHQPGALHDP